MTDALTDLIERLKELDAKRTRGAWEFFGHSENGEKEWGVQSRTQEAINDPECVASEISENDARFIDALANESLPALIAAQEREKADKAEIARLREALDAHQNLLKNAQASMVRYLQGSSRESSDKNFISEILDLLDGPAAGWCADAARTALEQGEG
jgi:hypothetical protein